MTTVHLLTNPAARTGAAAAEVDDIRRLFAQHDATVVDLAGDDAQASAALVRRAVDEGAERLVVCGGDGLVHLAIQAAAQTPTVVGICPMGTGNDFARGVGIETDGEQAAAGALGPPTPIDLMRIGDRWGASVATAGFSVAVNKRANSMRFPRGPSRYSLATLLELPRMHPTAYEISVDGEDYELLASVVTVANTSNFGGGMRITPAARPDDGLLDVTIVGAVGRLELLRWFRKVFDGSHLDHPMVTTLRGRAITLAAADTDVWADGEPVAATPVTVEAVPGALLLAGVTLQA